MKGEMQNYFGYFKKFENKSERYHQFLMIESLASTFSDAFKSLLVDNTSSKMY